MDAVEFYHKIMDVVNAGRRLTNTEVVKLVEEKFTTNNAMVPCSAYRNGGLCKLFICWKCGSAPCQIIGTAVYISCL
jgi:hypothetical protein